MVGIVADKIPAPRVGLLAFGNRGCYLFDSNVWIVAFGPAAQRAALLPEHGVGIYFWWFYTTGEHSEGMGGTFHFQGWRLEAGGWRLEAGGWRLEAWGLGLGARLHSIHQHASHYSPMLIICMPQYLSLTFHFNRSKAR